MRLVVYDRTCTRGPRGLSPVWAAGARLYRALGRIADARGVASWGEALAWLCAQPEPVDEIQYWGHGRWGRALIGSEPLDAGALHRNRAAIAAVRERLAPGALVWFRTCETFGARAGLDFAERAAEAFGARVAGHTYVIAFHQSGLHGVAPGVRADWPADEGLAAGSPDHPVRARWSRPWLPRTVTCLTAEVPESFFTRHA